MKLFIIIHVSLNNFKYVFCFFALFSMYFDTAAHRPVLVLESAHPSPLSAYRGFFGSAPFGKVNAFLKNNGAAEIDWRLPANATHG